MPNFETFVKRSVPLTKQPMVTLQKQGTISMNKASFLALGQPQAVELLYDADDRILGCRAVSPEEQHAYPVRRQGEKGGSFIVAGRAFTHYYGIPTDVSRRYAAQMYGDVLGVDLKQDGLEVTSNRNGRRGNGHAVQGS